jgi:hypothetical protein
MRFTGSLFRLELSGSCSQWLERVAILFLASFVVQSFVRGSSLTDPVVIVGTIAALVAYYGAARLMLKA